MALSRGQRKFAKYLSRYTGLSPRVVGAWELAEGNTTDWNKLNIGWTDSGRTSDSRHGFTSPKQGARTTAYWIRHKADPRIRDILNTAGHGPHRQIRAIWQSPWASGHYYGGSTLRSTYQSLGGQLPNRPVSGRIRGGGGGGGGGRRGGRRGGSGPSRPQTPASVRTSLSSGGASDSGIDAIAQRLSQSTNPPPISAPAPPPFAAHLALPQGYQGDSLESGGPAPATSSIKEALASLSASGSGPQFSRSVHGGNGGGGGRVGRASRNGGPGESVSGGGSAAHALQWARHRLGIHEAGENVGPHIDKWESRFHMHAQPWCFAAGTLVSTPWGLKPIETLSEGDPVYTASGIETRVALCHSRPNRPVYALVAHGLDETVVTGNHKYWARRRLGGKWDREFGEPEWIPAAELQRGDLLRFPRRLEDELALRPELTYVIGRWLADGWKTVKGAYVCCAHNEADGLRVKLVDADLGFSESDYPTVTQFALRKEILPLLQGCGDGARDKHLPSTALAWSPTAKQALLDGYLDGDGWARGDGMFVANTVSRELAHGMVQLARSLGYVPTLRRYEREEQAVIGGRTVNQAPYRWVVQLRQQTDGHDRPQFQTDADGVWAPVRSVEPCGKATVYNLTVAHPEHSYIADGAAVSNCGIFVGNAVRKAGVHAPDDWAATEAIAAHIRSRSGGFLGQVSQRHVKKGDIAVWNPGPSGHTGLVVKVFRDGSFNTIEGNAGDSVEINHHTSATVIGRPAYPGNHWGHHRRRGKH